MDERVLSFVAYLSVFFKGFKALLLTASLTAALMLLLKEHTYKVGSSQENRASSGWLSNLLLKSRRKTAQALGSQVQVHTVVKWSREPGFKWSQLLLWFV
jgi:hypothetical protein